MAPLGRLLGGFTGPGGAPVFLGTPQILGAEGNVPLRQLGERLTLRPLPRTLGGQLAEWVEEGTALARMRLIVLPPAARLSLTETGAGRLRISASGLKTTWHLALSAGEAEVRAGVSSTGEVSASLEAGGLPGVVRLRLSDPQSGAALELSTLWPSRQPLLIAPDGRRLDRDRQLSLDRLSGWRGYLPGARGAVLLRMAGRSAQVGFAAPGEVRLTSLAPVIGQVLSLQGADGRVNLRLADGIETNRIEICRYDWACEGAGATRALGPGCTQLAAVSLDDPARTARTEAESRIDMAAWLGEGEGLWFVQARNDMRGAMRPLVWSAQPLPHSTRDQRLAGYAADWVSLLEDPGHPGWDRNWALISAVRRAGHASSLDQVQALGRVPAAAVALLFSAARAERAEALALEAEAPIWWPLLPCSSWEVGVKAAHARIVVRLSAAGIEGVEATAAAALARIAGEIVALRPELAAHLGQALTAVSLPPMATDANGASILLAGSTARLAAAAQDAARRFDRLPQGTDGLRAMRLVAPAVTNDANAAILHAPLVVAEVATGLRPAPVSDETLRLIALRAADQIWFDAALPAALTQAIALRPETLK